MAINVTGTLRKALRQLEQEKNVLETRIVAIRTALNGVRGTSVVDRDQPVRQRRRRMSAAARKAIGRRMKAYWAKRKAAAASKGKEKNRS